MSTSKNDKHNHWWWCGWLVALLGAINIITALGGVCVSAGFFGYISSHPGDPGLEALLIIPLFIVTFVWTAWFTIFGFAYLAMGRIIASDQKGWPTYVCDVAGIEGIILLLLIFGLGWFTKGTVFGRITYYEGGGVLFWLTWVWIINILAAFMTAGIVYAIMRFQQRITRTVQQMC